MEYTKNTCLLLQFIGKKLDQSEEFDVIGQQVSYCRRLEQHNALARVGQ